MASSKRQNRPELIVRPGQQLVQVPDEENGKPITRVYVRDGRRTKSNSDDDDIESSALDGRRLECARLGGN